MSYKGEFCKHFSSPIYEYEYESLRYKTARFERICNNVFYIKDMYNVYYNDINILFFWCVPN